MGVSDQEGMAGQCRDWYSSCGFGEEGRENARSPGAACYKQACARYCLFLVDGRRRSGLTRTFCLIATLADAYTVQLVALVF